MGSTTPRSSDEDELADLRSTWLGRLNDETLQAIARQVVAEEQVEKAVEPLYG